MQGVFQPFSIECRFFLLFCEKSDIYGFFLGIFTTFINFILEKYSSSQIFDVFFLIVVIGIYSIFDSKGILEQMLYSQAIFRSILLFALITFHYY